MDRRTRTKVPPRFLTTQYHLANEERVYQAARAYATEHGKPPSSRALEPLLGLDHVTVHRHLDDLVRKGRITKTVHGRRTIDMQFPEQP